ncbi:AfsR/SARP family transcriptional regulator [Streptacidiphilus melanogenes]|uniref:AfsR/SARP family transcriptional regulator n=1 Tax=Streptacidiphilus melanogenes TaxID=411235 RepID=UPI000693E717|nr:BTAD domain-containing putative transcriptional regulator [Streptacidiphilus melanogenes]
MGEPGLWFGLLGSLEIRRDGLPLDLPGPRQRALLTALLLRANQVVGLDELADSVWQGKPTEAAATTLRSYVMRLRRVLGPADGGRVRAVGTGYRLEVRPGELDLQVFTDLAARGRRARAACEWAQCAAVLGEALALWRGEPLPDLARHAGEHPDVEGLRELRLQALDWRIEADLRLGRHAEVLAELRALTAQHPLVEVFHAQLMLALYRSGRQADALAAYEQARQVLAEELGADPGPPLQQLHRRVLALDPSLDLEPGTEEATRGPEPDAAPVGGAASTFRSPAQLPADLPDFTGRRVPLKRLRDLLLPSVAGAAAPRAVVVSTITGTGGIGKTTLAVHTAHQVAASFPDGQLYVDLRGMSETPLSPAEVLGDALRALGVPDGEIPRSEEARSASFRTLLAGRRMLLLLDNAHDAAQVRPLLPGDGGCGVLVTCRTRLVGLAGAATEYLDVWEEAEAAELFAAVVGRERVAAEPEAVREVLAHCAGLPLAVRIAASRLASRPGWTVAHLASRLADERERLDTLDTADAAVRTSFRVSYTQLVLAERQGVSDAGRAFRLLGLAPLTEIGVDAAAALFGLGVREAERLLEQLVDVSLLESPAPGRYRMHDLLRSYARECAAQDEQEGPRYAAVARLVGWYVRTAEQAMDLVYSHRRRFPSDPAAPGPAGLCFDTAAAALSWCETERANLVAVTRLAGGSGLDTEAWTLPANLLHFFNMRGHLTEWLECFTIGLAHARRAGSADGEAWMLGGLSVAHRVLEQYDLALTESQEAVEVCRRSGDVPGEATHTSSLASVLHLLGRSQEAVLWFERALPLRRQVGDLSGVAATLNNLGCVHHANGSPDRAADCYREALEISRGSGLEYLEAAVLDGLGSVSVDLGEGEAAVSFFRESIGIRVRIGDTMGEAVGQENLGDALAAQDRVAQAREAWEQAAALLRRTGHPGEARISAKLAASDGAASPA